MKSYEELLSDIEEDMELMGSSHIVYSMEEDGVVTDYDYLPSDSCTISITLKELQEKLQLQMLYAKVSAHTAGADKNAPKLAVVFPGIGYTADKPLLYYSVYFQKHWYSHLLSLCFPTRSDCKKHPVHASCRDLFLPTCRKHRLPRHRRSLGRNQFHPGTGSAERCTSLSHPKRQPFSGNR